MEVENEDLKNKLDIFTNALKPGLAKYNGHLVLRDAAMSLTLRSFQNVM